MNVDTEKPHILIFIGTLLAGGAERQFSYFAKDAAHRGYQITLVTLFPGGPFWDELERDGLVTLHSLFTKRYPGRLGSLWQLALTIIRLRSLIKTTKPQVVYTSMYLGNLICWLSTLGLKSVHLIGGLRASNMNRDWRYHIPMSIGAWFCHKIPLIIANSEAGSAYHQKVGYDKARIVVIPNGIDTERFRPDKAARQKLRKEWNIADHEIVIGRIGRMDPMKDYPTFLQAVSRLSQEYDNLRFVCVGTGKDEYINEIHSYAHSLGLENVVDWVGVREDMPAVYNALDIFCSSSAYGEGFPNVIGEAMACGLPCVVTDVGDSKIVVEDNGIVIAPGDLDALYQGLRDTIDALQIGQPMQEARKKIVEKYSVARMATDTLSYCHEIANLK